MPQVHNPLYFLVRCRRGRSAHPIFTTPADYRAFERHLGRCLDADGLTAVAYALHPRGWDLLLGPTNPRRLATGLARVGRSRPDLASPMVTTALHGINAVVLGARCIERLALDAGLVRRAQDWPWSSLQRRATPASPLPLVTAPFLASRAWRDYVNLPRPGGGASIDAAEPPRLLT